MATLKVKILDQKHPEYDDHGLEQRRALYEGGDRWHELVKHWLPRNPQEKKRMWDLRLKQAGYENNVAPIIDLIAGGLMSQPPVVQDLEGDWVEDFLQNVDLQGNSFATWAQQCLVDALVNRRVWAWVNAPARPDDMEIRSRADEQQLGLNKPFLVALDSTEVCNWQHDGRGRLLWVMHRAVTSEQDSIETERHKVYTWTYIDARVIRRWVWKPPPSRPHAEPRDEEEVTELPPIEHGLGEIPVIEKELRASLHMMGKLQDPATSLLRRQNDYDWALHMAAHPLWWIRTRDDPVEEGADELADQTGSVSGASGLVLGTGAFLNLDRDADGEDSAGLVETSGSSYQLHAERITQLREALYRVAHQMAVGADSNSTRALMSGLSKAEDWRATEILLTAYADSLRPFLEEVLRVASLVNSRTSPQTPTVDGLSGWHQEDLQDWLESIPAAPEAMRMSETLHRVVAKEQVHRILPDLDEETRDRINEEIDAAPVNLEAFQPLGPREDLDDDDEDDEPEDQAA